MRRLALAILVVLLALSASGASSLIVDEPCTGHEMTGQGDDEGQCPPWCVTCGCCAQAAEAVYVMLSDTPETPVGPLAPVLPHIPAIEPADILHVPRFVLA